MPTFCELPSCTSSRSELVKLMLPLLLSSASSLPLATWKLTDELLPVLPWMRKASSPALSVEIVLVPPGHSGVQLLSLGV